MPRGENVVPAVEDLHRVALALMALRTADGQGIVSIARLLKVKGHDRPPSSGQVDRGQPGSSWPKFAAGRWRGSCSS